MKILSVVRQFAREITSNSQIVYVEHRPESGAVFDECFRNVGGKIERDGGTSQYGWLFQQGKGFLVAIHHCVWRDTNGQLVDVSPIDQRVRDLTLVIEGKIVFLPDESATPIKPPGYEYGLARANRVHVYSSSADTASVAQFIRQERAWEEELGSLAKLDIAVKEAVERIRREASERGGCGGCHACCHAIGILELNKPYWQLCPHQCTTGCAIYSTRPQSCKGFYCSYLMGDTPADTKYRPDNLGILICLDTANTAEGVVGLVVDCWELRPGTFAANPWVKQLAQKIAQRHNCLNVSWWPHLQQPLNWSELGIKDK